MPSTRHAGSRRLPLLLLVVLIGLNLRPFLTTSAPLAAAIRADTGMTLQAMSLLTLVPMALMGLLAFAGPAIRSALGEKPSIIMALSLMGAGSLARLFVSNGPELVATAILLGAGVAIIQAVFPGVLKRCFAENLAVVMGLYSAMLMGGGAAGARLAPLFAGAAGGWRSGLGWLAVPAMIATAAAAIILPRSKSACGKPSVSPAGLLSLPRSWLLILCFGLVNGGYSTAIAWLAPFYQERGWSASASGSLLAVMALAQGMAALLFPVLARHGRDRRGWLWSTLALQAGGYLGLAIAPDLAPSLWAVCLGAGLGASFALTMVLALDHLAEPAAAGALAAIMQGGGFLLAAVAPWVVALLHDRTGNFTAGWIMHLANVAVVAILTTRFAPGEYARAMSRQSRRQAFSPISLAALARAWPR